MQKIPVDSSRHSLAARLLQSSSLAMFMVSTVTAASAQETTSPAKGDLPADNVTAQVVVTGSRIRGVAPVGSSLVQVGVEDIKRSGAVTVAELLKEIPQVTSMGFNAEGSLGAAAPQNITRSTAPNLRGIGPQATLTLLDGQRVPAAGPMGNVVDPSFLPPLTLQRIEVIADGASAVYGSDAVAGVINLIPRKRFQGVEVMARAGSADGYKDTQFGGIAGKTWDGGSGIISFDFADNGQLMNSDRDFVSADRRRFGGADGRSTACSPGTISRGGVTYPLKSGNGQGVLMSGLTAGPANRCDITEYNTLIPETTRKSVFGYAEHKISESAKLYVQGFYYTRDGRSARRQYTLNNYTVPRTNAFFPADALASPTPLVINYNLQNELGSNFADISSELFQFSTGIDGDFGDYHYKVSASTGQGEDEENNSTALQGFALAQAMASSNPATALNVFGGPGSNSAAVLGLLPVGNAIQRGRTRLDTVSAGIDGPLFAMAGGDVRIALGGEVRRDSSDAYNLNSTDSRTSSVPVITQSSVSRNIKAVYGEVFVPLFGAKNNIPGVKQLDLSIAGRWEEYSDFGTTANPKFGANWKPADGVMVHASYGTSFRAPSLSESNPRGAGAGIYQTQTVIPGRGLVSSVALAGGDANLEPEKAKTKSFGIDFAPTSLPGLKMGLTYFDIAYDNQVVEGYGLQGNYLLDPVTYAKYVAYPGAANYESLKNMIETSGYTTPGTINYTGAALLDARKTNTAAVNVNGLDFQLSNIWRAGADTYTLRANMTHYLNYEEAPNGRVFLDRTNVIAYPAKNSGRVSGAWGRGDWSAQLTANYTNSYRNNLSTLVPSIKAYTTLDMDLAYRIEGKEEGTLDGLRIALNVRNLADKAPPVADYSTGYDPSKTSALGRVIAITATKSW